VRLAEEALHDSDDQKLINQLNSVRSLLKLLLADA